MVSLAQGLGKVWISNSKRIVTNIILGGQVLNTEVADDHNENVNDNVDNNEDDDDKTDVREQGKVHFVASQCPHSGC